MLREISKTLTPSYDQSFLVGLFVIFLSFLFKLFCLLVIFPYCYFYEVKHYLLYAKNKDNHKDFGWNLVNEGNVLHTSYKDKCSCGRKAPGKNLLEAVEKSIRRSIYD